jgi:RNA polymerase sigma factor (sigma-70 family)
MNPTFARLARLAADLSRDPDGRLLDLFLAGSQPAFRELVTRHGPLVFAVCRRVLGHRQDAEDAFQAAFLVLARRAADVWPRDAVGSWLYGVAHRVALKARSARARRLVREQPLEDAAGPPSPAPEPDLAEVIDRAVRRLPEAYRAAVVACDLEGLSRAEAAERLGWKEGTLSGRLSRARQRLADLLRQAGLTAPAGGLAAVLGTDAPVRAGLVEAVVELVAGDAAGGIPLPVAALTEGVVTGMFAFKLKAAAVLVACSLGVGAWAAGDGPGAGAGGAGQGTAAQPAKAAASARADDLKMLQGKWFVESVTLAEMKPTPTAEGRDFPLFEIADDILTMPARKAASEWMYEKYTITVDAAVSPKQIDLAQSGKVVNRGIYEFGAPAATCAKCHTGPLEGLGRGVPDPLRFDPHGWCGPGLKEFARNPRVELRLALGTDGKRPAKFGGSVGVIEYRLTRVAADGKPAAEAPTADDLLKDAQARRQIELQRERVLADEDVRRAQAAAEVAAARLREAEELVSRYQHHVQAAKAQVMLAQEGLAEAKRRAEVAGKKPAAAKEPGKDEPAFTVHVRPQLAAEKVIRVKATGKETVLEGLAYAAEDMGLKPDTLSVWVVRDKAVLPVDLAAITQKGDPKTNYALKAGDQLFVQVKVGK